MNKILGSLILTGVLTLSTSTIVNADTITQEGKIGSKIPGYEVGTSKPDTDANKQITRAEFIHIVNEVLEYKVADEKPSLDFKDVNKNQWFYEDVLIAREKGYIAGGNTL